jgi:hypothetical protein
VSSGDPRLLTSILRHRRRLADYLNDPNALGRIDSTYDRLVHALVGDTWSQAVTRSR